MQNISYIVASIKVTSMRGGRGGGGGSFLNNHVAIGHSSSIYLTYRIFLQTHVIFCEYLVFHVFRRNL